MKRQPVLYVGVKILLKKGRVRQLANQVVEDLFLKIEAFLKFQILRIIQPRPAVSRQRRLLNDRKPESPRFEKRHCAQNLSAAVGRQANIPFAAGAHGVEPPRLQMHWHIVRSAEIGVAGFALGHGNGTFAAQER